MQRLLRLTPVLLGLAFAAPAFGQSSAVPTLVSYQSRVTDASGNLIGAPTPVNRIALFRIYDSAGGSARLYSEQQTVTIANGEFSILLGTGTQIGTDTGNTFSTFNAAVFAGATRFLGVTIDDGDGNPFNDPEMSPRQQLATTPFAFRSAVAESVALGGVNALSLANNSVGTAAIASAAITNEKLAANAVATTQLADNAVNTAKLTANAVDSSKIADGSIVLADLSPALQATMPKPSFTYNQGLGSVTTANSVNGYTTFMVFPIDVSDLGVDGEVLISYVGARRAGGTLSSQLPAFFSGRVRVNVLNFVPGTVQASYVNGSPPFRIGTATAGTGTVADANTPFVAFSEGPIPESNYAVSGFMNSSTVNTTLLADPVSALAGLPVSWMFPKMLSYFPTGNYSSGLYYGGNHTTPPLAHLIARYIADGASTGPSGHTVHVPLISIFHYYPGSLSTAISPFNVDQANVSTNTNAGGPAQTHSVASVVTGTNKLTITVPNPHVMQVGDAVVIAGMTGAPAANGSFTVSAVPDPTSFEITLNGAAGSYSGGTITHTPRYNKYRLWVAVCTAVAARVTVSDK